MSSTAASVLRPGDRPVIERFHVWQCHFCKKPHLDADFHDRNTVLPDGRKLPVEVIEFWTGTEPVCTTCGLERGMHKDDFED